RATVARRTSEAGRRSAWPPSLLRVHVDAEVDVLVITRCGDARDSVADCADGRATRGALDDERLALAPAQPKQRRRAEHGDRGGRVAGERSSVRPVPRRPPPPPRAPARSAQPSTRS